MIRFAVISLVGVLLLWGGLNAIRQLTAGERLLDAKSLKVALRLGSGQAWFAIFVTLIGALIVAISVFVFTGTLIILIFDPV
ncbi:MAG: hypothetical protein P8Z31_01435 [Gammaproteobacteria bacterium]|jgi:hypothetical protein